MENKEIKMKNHIDFLLKLNSPNKKITFGNNHINRNTSFNKNIKIIKNRKLNDIKLSLAYKRNFPNKINNLTVKKCELKSLQFKNKNSINKKRIFESKFEISKFKLKNCSLSSKEKKLINEDEQMIKDDDRDIDNDTQIININRENKLYSIFHFIKTNNIFVFINNLKNEDIFKNNNNLIKNSEFEILENIELPPAYKPRMNKYEAMPQCIINTCSNGNISIIKNEDNCNLIWKLLPPEKLRELIRRINKNQKFNHFPCTYRIGLKDNMYLHYKKYNKLFPDFYNFVPDTYILPNDAEIFEKIYKKNKHILWIVKPVNMSRGRGVHLLKDINELKDLIKKSKEENTIPDLINRYLDKPHLINKKKYDLRIYVLVTSFSPLKIYLYQNGLVRFATEDYRQGDYDNIYVHVTNYSINKNNINYKSNQINDEKMENQNEDKSIEIDDSSKWSLVEYRNYFKKLGLNDTMDDIWKQIENIIIKSLITVVKENCQEISINKNNSLFELYGYDILIDEEFKAWLLEVNVNPSLHCTSPLDLSIKTDLVTDIFNIIGIIPFNHNNGETVYNYEMIKNKENEKEKENYHKKNKSKSLRLPYLYNLSGNKKFDKTIINIRTTIVQNFNIENLKIKTNEYENEYYKKIVETYKEEKIRAGLTKFSMIFPKKDNIEFYSKIMVKTNSINDTNIVLWEHILNNE